jgi:murein DD-endopeptidase MepM/ murein hydrolase activator NlpD
MKLILQSPLKTTLHINQYFGQNATNLYKSEGLPGHNGIDFSATHGQPVYATHNGRAYFEIDQGGGHGVVLISDQMYNYLNTQAQYKTIYWHFCDSLKEPQFRSPIQDFVFGKDVKTGDLLGYADSTGASTGDHLHFGLKPVAANGESQNSWYNIEQNNGYMGAIDPFQYFDPSLHLVPLVPNPVESFPNLSPVIPAPIVVNGQVTNWVQRWYWLLRSVGLDSWIPKN